MSFNRRMTRPDSNQELIVDSLRLAGVLVWIIGSPCDLLTLYRGRWQPLEVKPTTAKRARKDQASQNEFLVQTGTPVVKTVYEALQAVGVKWTTNPIASS